MRARLVPRVLAAMIGAALLAGCGQYADLRSSHETGPKAFIASHVGGYAAGSSLDGLARGPLMQLGEPEPSDPAAADPHEGAETAGPLFACPVRGLGYYVGNYGAYRPGPPVHRHQGNDIFVPRGTPIQAPFDGFAVATPNTLGGRAVKVIGDAGYVYNAHLSRYGHLGSVRTGQVIGFVGSSGNAAASDPHDHFEWHPDGGAAVDPFTLLGAACTSGGREP